MSRHRGAKHRRRYELLGGISLLSPEYLLSVERWPFHSEPPDHYDLLSHLLAPSRSQSSWLMPCTNLLMSDQISQPSCSSVTLWEETAPVKLPTRHCPQPGSRVYVTLEHQPLKGGISRMAPRRLASTLQSLPPILHIKDQCSVSSYSKGSRGLSVLPRVHCIFTASSISLSLGWRQPAIITPFVQVGTYPTRNFATLGPL